MFIERNYLNRTLCDVLQDMRKCDAVKNYSNLLSLIEEAQVMGNRMEAGLSDKQDYKDYRREVKRLKKELKRLKSKKEKLNE